MKNVRNRRLAAGFLLIAVCLGFCVTTEAAALPEKLTPLGIPVGLRSGEDGVTVAGILDAETSPAALAGLRPGDVLLAADGVPLQSAAAFGDTLTADRPVTLTVRRQGECLRITVQPEQTESGCRIGVWLRDSVLGIGTLTFYDPATGLYGALGHGVAAAEGKGLANLNGGSIIPAQVTGVQRGIVGEPGELHGSFSPDTPLGSCTANTPCGVFGELATVPTQTSLPTARIEQIEVGAAEILTCIDGDTPARYAIRIVKVDAENADCRNLLIEVTDEELLRRCGGIVQGMSGSPILQNGRLVGAVTHVMVNHPTRGYGVAIENMLRLAP